MAEKFGATTTHGKLVFCPLYSCQYGFRDTFSLIHYHLLWSLMLLFVETVCPENNIPIYIMEALLVLAFFSSMRASYAAPSQVGNGDAWLYSFVYAKCIRRPSIGGCTAIESDVIRNKLIVGECLRISCVYPWSKLTSTRWSDDGTARCRRPPRCEGTERFSISQSIIGTIRNNADDWSRFTQRRSIGATSIRTASEQNTVVFNKTIFLVNFFITVTLSRSVRSHRYVSHQVILTLMFNKT